MKYRVMVPVTLPFDVDADNIIGALVYAELKAREYLALLGKKDKVDYVIPPRHPDFLWRAQEQRS